MWVIHPDGDRDLLDNRECWKPALLDQATGEITTPVEISAPGVTVDGTETVWITDGQITAVHTQSGPLPQSTSLADLRDRTRAGRGAQR